MIALDHVTKEYGGDRPALVDVSLAVEKGEFVYLTGPSGAGKSTLLRLIMAAEAPTAGEIVVAGKRLDRLRASSIPYLRRNLGVVFQDFKLLEGRTAFANVALALEVVGTPSRDLRRKVLAVLRRVGLADREDTPVERLSGGEQQRVAIARALVNDPQVLLADEPTGNLDADRTAEVMDLLQSANARGATVVLATHDPGILARFPKRTVRLAGGRVVEDRA
jgi:cell division transport system ATP-binding protein